MRMYGRAHISGALHAPSASRVSSAPNRLGGARWVMLALGMALCVALLSACGSPTTTASSNANAGVQQTQTAGAYQVTLRVSPDTFGANTFTVTLKDAQGKPLQGANVKAAVAMLDMDMGVQTLSLQPSGGAGVYAGQMTLSMAGHWGITVKVKPSVAQQATETSFKVTVAN